jgi:hypothetical protein
LRLAPTTPVSIVEQSSYNKRRHQKLNQEEKTGVDAIEELPHSGHFLVSVESLLDH